MSIVETTYTDAVAKAARATALVGKITPLAEAAQERELSLDYDEWEAGIDPNTELHPYSARALSLERRLRVAKQHRDDAIRLAALMLAQADPDFPPFARWQEASRTSLYGVTFRGFVTREIDKITS